MSVVNPFAQSASVLDGAQEVAAGDSNAAGVDTLILGSNGESLSYELTVSGLDFGAFFSDGKPQTEDTGDDVIGLHIHSGSRGENGPIAFGLIDIGLVDRQFDGQDVDDITFSLNSDGSTTIRGVWDETDPASIALSQFVDDIQNAAPGEDIPLYWNVHTNDFRGGAIRGQFLGENAPIVGTAAAEELQGTEGNDILDGLGGGDTLVGLGGNDVLLGGGGADINDGGEGIDTANFSDIGAPVTALLGQGLASYVPASGVTVIDTLISIENLSGTENDDQLFGDRGTNVIDGGGGNDLVAGGGGDDVLQGNEGDDVLRGGGGNDTLNGGNGNDTADFSDIGFEVTANLAQSSANYVVASGANVVDSLSNIENLSGSSNDDHLTGDDASNLIAGAAGDDTLLGGDGDDVLRGDEIGDGTALVFTVENLQTNGGTFYTPLWLGVHDGTFDLYDRGGPARQGLERLAEDGTIAPISAEFVAEQLAVGGVDGTIFGGQGVPGPIDPGETAQIVLDVDDPSVARFFTWGTMVIPSNDAFLATTGNPLGEPIFDADGNFLGPITIERTGNDVLDAGTEVNTEEGAAFLNQTAPDEGTPENGVVIAHPGFNGSERNPDGTPVNILGGLTAPGAMIDPVVGDFTQNGGEDLLLRITIDELAAQGGNDVIDGGLGDDLIEGGAGSDLLAGGLGDDVLFGGKGDDTLRGDLNNRNPQVGVGGNDVLRGGAGNDAIGGKGGNDQLFGDDGDDLLFGDDGDDILTGGAGNDRLQGDDFSGGSGADTFVIEAGAGTDTIVDFQLGTDLIGLGAGLSFAQLSLRGNSILFGDETLATLSGIQTASLAESSFITI
ncbi:type I secretion target GGXGXDXXX repeat protein domain protein [Synechococcus sp. PCC 7335]|uniref:spondin domain-containing protein n=1 Tax=Synechococcus sp. (strain ATCC 29403 / PCC 7335) TaxID=91464 RepID=UPI00017EE4A0|nr:spondin domain-containing protein [Synechococcus sp. PCC 7335]EDX83039.1 type I secretion target GGXGXDXXX repeat protein domain protein [Synechococcus sp. PCC 7335]